MKRVNAFTLIELLVVVATTGILVSVMLPALASARRTARKAVCASHLHQLGLASCVYLNDHNEHFWPWYKDVAGGRLWWFGFEPGGPQPFNVPNRPLDKSRSPLAPYLTSLDERFQCPAFPYNDPGYFPKFNQRSASLAYNAYVGLPAAPMTRIQYSNRETEVFIFADAIHFDQAATFNEGHYIQPNPNTAMMSGYAHFRHTNTAQMVMIDGHVEAQTLTGPTHRIVDGGSAGNLVAPDGSDAVYGK